MKTELVLGFIPEGWTKGEQLVIHSPPLYSDRRVTRGYIVRKYMTSVVCKKPTRHNPNLYTFDSTEIEDVQKWIDWWSS